MGKTLEEALIALERLEHAAFTYRLARLLGEPQSLSQEDLDILRAMGDKIRSTKM